MNKNSDTIINLADANVIIPKLLEICTALSTIDVQPIYAEIKEMNPEEDYKTLAPKLKVLSSKLGVMKQPTSGRQQLVEDFISLIEKYEFQNDAKIRKAREAKMKADEAAAKKKREDEVEKEKLANSTKNAKANVANIVDSLTNKKDNLDEKEKQSESDNSEQEKSTEKEENKNIQPGSEIENTQTEKEDSKDSNEGSSLDDESSDSKDESEVVVAETIGKKVVLTKAALKKFKNEQIAELKLVAGDIVYVNDDNDIQSYQKKNSEEIVKL